MLKRNKNIKTLINQSYRVVRVLKEIRAVLRGEAVGVLVRSAAAGSGHGGATGGGDQATSTGADEGEEGGGGQ